MTLDFKFIFIHGMVLDYQQRVSLRSIYLIFFFKRMRFLLFKSIKTPLRYTILTNPNIIHQKIFINNAKDVKEIEKQWNRHLQDRALFG